MSRVATERCWTQFDCDPAAEAAVLAEEIRARRTPRLTGYLADHPGWYEPHELHALLYRSSKFTLTKWYRLLWALEVTGDIVIEERRNSHGGITNYISISASGWLREVQRGTTARAGDAVLV